MLAVGSGQLAVGSGQLAVGSGQLAVGSGQLAVGSGQLAVGSWQGKLGLRVLFSTWSTLSADSGLCFTRGGYRCYSRVF